MKLGMKQHAHIATGVKKEIKVAFETNAVAFYATFSGLAKDKIGYPMRELSTNAWDVARGNFEVHLPTRLNPVFRIRDYGTGMSEEAMENVYAKPYASTKRDTNTEVGGWGIGSKSPYAYLIGDTGSGSYNITSYYNGRMLAYIMSLADDGMPKMDLLHDGPTDQPNGMEVSFAVRRDDIEGFAKAARDILWSFQPRPTIFPEGAVTWKEPVVLSEGDNWTKYKEGSVPFYGPRVRMGCVMYPFDLDQVETSGFLDYDDVVLFDAPIGSLKVILSREELAYDETTKTTLKSLVKQYEDSFIEQLREKVDAAETLFEAAAIFEKETETLGRSRTERLRSIVDWQGLRITETLSKANCKMDTLGEGWQQFDKFEDTTVRTQWAADATVVIEHNPSYSLSRFHMAQLVGKKVLWVRCKRLFRDDVLAALGNPEVIELDTFKVPVTKRVSKTIRKRKTIMVTSGGRLQRLTQDVDLAEGGLMVEQFPSYTRRRGGSNDFYRLHGSQTASISFSDVEGFVMTAFEFGLIEVGTVILVKSQDQVVQGDWTMLADDMIQPIRDKVNVAEFTGLHKKSLNNLNHNLQEVAKMEPFAKAPADIKLFHEDLKTLYAQLESNSTASTDSDKAFAALKKVGVEVNKPDVACPIAAISKRFEVLCGEYMLLKAIVEQHTYYSHRNTEKIAKLEHYFELLSRPAAANDNEEVEFTGAELDQAA
ncbi:hypothetical protein FXV83_16065 [Bradyrhizobium hipponense]|uniref:Uncharacterized protein n=1 Tax=Bradyrhizobium hipponense TaxID=2605638 RepID=A0A5S4YWW0_9BRAD|nr:hypothetical protein [Bradyrhizobium hipponense]TYO65449.1 hypothetical protein FXV83_16065 [Bradyrhizobium hipponense]